mmetsp:Transcript_93759/g.284731  ORF Transcript_93759/g.284731 Transcript_93759/m.284731 type:complete len:326 (+) Transcript_93759:712-1689(+)
MTGIVGRGGYARPVGLAFALQRVSCRVLEHAWHPLTDLVALGITPRRELFFGGAVLSACRRTLVAHPLAGKARPLGRVVLVHVLARDVGVATAQVGPRLILGIPLIPHVLLVLAGDIVAVATRVVAVSLGHILRVARLFEPGFRLAVTFGTSCNDAGFAELELMLKPGSGIVTEGSGHPLADLLALGIAPRRKLLPCLAVLDPRGRYLEVLNMPATSTGTQAGQAFAVVRPSLVVEKLLVGHVELVVTWSIVALPASRAMEGPRNTVHVTRLRRQLLRSRPLMPRRVRSSCPGSLTVLRSVRCCGVRAVRRCGYARLVCLKLALQ